MQVLLFLVAVLSVPVMLFGKPCLLARRQEARLRQVGRAAGMRGPLTVDYCVLCARVMRELPPTHTMKTMRNTRMKTVMVSTSAASLSHRLFAILNASRYVRARPC